MMAWFQRWQQSLGDGVTTTGDPIVARTAYGTAPGRLPLRQAVHELYTEPPQRDETIHLAAAPGADAFVLASYHTMWPGYTLTYRYLWQDGAWTGPLSVAENDSDVVSAPVYVGGASSSALIRYVYTDAWVLKTRTELNGVLGAPVSIGDYLAARGVTGTPLGYFTDAVGGLHLVLVGEKAGVAGFYYVKP